LRPFSLQLGLYCKFGFGGKERMHGRRVTVRFGEAAQSFVLSSNSPSLFTSIPVW